MKKLLFFIALLIAPTMAHAWPWSMDMANQISSKPQESVDPSNPGMKPFPALSAGCRHDCYGKGSRSCTKNGQPRSG